MIKEMMINLNVELMKNYKIVMNKNNNNNAT